MKPELSTAFAGVLARHAGETQALLEQGDVVSALRAASAVGDDTLQRCGKGYVVPEFFTLSQVDAFGRGVVKRGLAGGSIQSCDTFSAPT